MAPVENQFGGNSGMFMRMRLYSEALSESMSLQRRSEGTVGLSHETTQPVFPPELQENFRQNYASDLKPLAEQRSKKI